MNTFDRLMGGRLAFWWALLAALVLLCTWPPAQAQLTAPLPVCVEVDVLKPPRAVPLPVKPIGLPVQLKGSCTTVLEANTEGAAAAFWCKQTAPKPSILYLYAVEWSAITPAMVTDYATLGLPGDNRARIQSMQVKYQTKNVLDMCNVWGPARDRINAARPAL